MLFDAIIVMFMMSAGVGARDCGALGGDWFVNGSFREPMHDQASHCCALLPSTL